MKLDPKNIRYLSPEDWRVLQAVEQGSRNHEIVPTQLITTLSNARPGSQSSRSISTLAKNNLISRIQNASYDGYRLTYGGLDYLSLHAHLQSSAIYSIGNQIGVGKESDIFVVASPTGRRLVLKIHRLGRISFRTVKSNRDYLRKGSSGSWMYMSRLAAQKEYSFMSALRNAGFPVPEPVAWNRHTVVMGLVDAFPLRQIAKVPDPPALYGQLMDLILRLARFGLIHGDFNEFNILVEEIGPSGRTLNQEYDEDEAVLPSNPHDQNHPAPTDKPVTLNPIIIDFPQTLSISHPNAEFYFNRDVNCIKIFFQRRFGFTSDEPGPFLADAIENVGQGEGVRRLDLEVEATGFNKKLAKELEKYMKELGVDGDHNGDGGEETDGFVGEDDGGEEDVSGEDVIEQDSFAEGAPEAEKEILPESSEDLAVKSTNTSDLVSSMTILKLSEQNLSALLEIPTATPTIPTKPAVDTISKAGTAVPRTRTVFSHAGTASSRRPPPNPAKVARGWAI
ncbi:RIO1-domain-containing protein [Tothia fuscella]|uniref:Serine/threonine-protein kinase RIO2 n=1 Tax=Tothia fuscella TaxID=1048955 RepID=A0A9P4U0N7_9PEZI|nr:RIO1-domain-containing protein [Tothia fuscella]